MLSLQDVPSEPELERWYLRRDLDVAAEKCSQSVLLHMVANEAVGKGHL
jgi:hypothetical protein